MTFSNPSFESDEQFIKATRILAFPHESTLGAPLVSHQEQLAAVESLKVAPFLVHWDNGLLQGLRNADAHIVEKTADACIRRLEQATEIQVQDRLIKSILDACFLNMAGRSRRLTPSDKLNHDTENLQLDRQERAAAKLITAVSAYLNKNGLEIDHHRARLLARARQIERMDGIGELANAIARFQDSLGKEAARSDNLDASELHVLRKSASYQEPKTSQPALLAYLEQDRRLSLEQISPDLFQMYRFLLNYQTKENAGQAIVAAIDNLIHWLKMVPWHEQRAVVVGDLLNNVRLKKPDWQELSLPVKRHLQAHLEILPGPDHPEDFLLLLRNKYNAAQGEEILVHGLTLLKQFPLLRYRAEELCTFILEPVRKQRKPPVWGALLSLVESLLTGLADFTLIESKAIGATEQKRNKIMQQVLAPDKRLQQTLEKLASDDQIPNEPRQEAWRILLRSLPPNLETLFIKGLHYDDGLFFIATVEEAAIHRQRGLWPLIYKDWQHYTNDTAPMAKRQANIKAIAYYFKQTCVYHGIQNDGQIGPMIALALDDKDPFICQLAKDAIISTGYQPELQREEQKRCLEQLSKDLFHNQHQVNDLDKKRTQLGREIDVQYKDRSSIDLEVQALLQQREGLVTAGWIHTAQLQVDLAELQEKLKARLQEARVQAAYLKDLQAQMRHELNESNSAYLQTKQLVERQASHEKEITSQQRQKDNAQHALRRSHSDKESAQNKLAQLEKTLRSVYAETPKIYPNDEAKTNRVKRQYQASIQAQERKVGNQQAKIERLNSDISHQQNTIARCQQAIYNCKQALEQLRQAITAIHSQIAGIETRVNGLSREFSHGLNTWAELRRAINQLQSQTQAVESRYANQRKTSKSNLSNNARVLEQQHNELAKLGESIHSLNTQLNQSHKQFNHFATRSQELNQAIDSGRESYDNIGAQATKSSKLADRNGESLQLKHQLNERENQESLAFYAHCIHQEISKQQPPATRSKQQQRKKPFSRAKSQRSKR